MLNRAMSNRGCLSAIIACLVFWTLAVLATILVLRLMSP